MVKRRSSQSRRTVGKIRGGYGLLPAGRMINRRLSNPKPDYGIMPSKSEPYSFKRALYTEGWGQLGRFKRYLGKYKAPLTKTVVSALTGARIAEKLMNRKSVKTPKTKTATEPLLDLEKGIASTVKGKQKMDKVYTVSRVKMDMSGPVKQRSFSTSVKFGKPTSKSIMFAAKQNGSKVLELYNSLTDPLMVATRAEREALEIYAGFNQKAIYSNNRLVPCWMDVLDNIYKVSYNNTIDPLFPNPDNSDKTKYTSLYGCAMSLSSTLMLRNNMNTTSVIVKVHFVMPKSSVTANVPWHAPLVRVGDFVTNNSAPIETQRVIKAPVDYERPYVRSNSAAETGSLWRFAPNAVSNAKLGFIIPSADITESESFNDSFTITRTLVKTLDVGDDWKINVTRTLGPGIRLDEALRVARNNNWSSGNFNSAELPLGHRVIIELVGKPLTVEAQYEDPYVESTTTAPLTFTAIQGQDKFIGTAPCSVNVEMRHSIRYVLQSYSGVPSSYNETDFSNRIGSPLIRAYVTDKTITAVPYNVDYWKTNGDISSTYWKSPIKINSSSANTVTTVTSVN